LTQTKHFTHPPSPQISVPEINKDSFFHDNIFVEYQIRYDELIFSLTFAFTVRTIEELESEMGSTC
jgi:hypothetical protein